MSANRVIFAVFALLWDAGSAQAAEASLAAAAQAVAGDRLEVRWTGPGAAGDFVSIDAPEAPDRTYGPYAYPSAGNPLALAVPDEPGRYVIRYHVANSYAVVASAPLEVTAPKASVTAPANVKIGGTLSVTWTGPNHPSDFISIDAVGAADGTYGAYAYTQSGTTLAIRAPDAPGDYLVRYHMAGSYRVLAAAPLSVIGEGATLEPPAAAKAGGAVSIRWTGPGHAGDFISIDATDAPERDYGSYAYPAAPGGSTVTIPAPDEPGAYQVRYHLAQSYRVIGAAPLRVDPVTASLASPGQATAGTVFEVRWEGPDNQNDFVAVVPVGAPDDRFGASNGYTRRGNPARIQAPPEPGAHELRYVTGQSHRILARASLLVTPSAIPGHLTVVSDPAQAIARFDAVEFVLDASGSMLQRLGKERRIDLARSALVTLARDVLPAGSRFALRVFGHKEADSCRTDLELPLAVIDKGAAVARIQSLKAMNLAKTPIAASLLLAREDLAGVKGPALVVLMTDGEETCDGDPKAAIQSLQAAGLDVRVNIVGFAVDDVALKETFQEWARVGNGGYFDAQDGEQLQRALRETLRASYEVVAKGAVVAAGTVNGQAIALPPGAYRVRLHGAPAKDLGEVQIESGSARELRF